MNPSKRDIIGLVIVVVCSLAIYSSTFDSSTPLLAGNWRALQYTTNSTRTDGVIATCSGLNRSNLIDSTDEASAKQYKAALTAQFSISGSTLISNAIAGQFGLIISTVQANISQFAIFLGVFLLGLLITILMWPFLCCCCCCPGCCPSKCCQKGDDEQYTKCELYWPSITLILILLVMIAASIAGFTKASLLATSTKSMSCSLSIVFDDLLNGNVTNDKSSFFIGLSTLSTQLGVLKTNINSIKTNLDLIKADAAIMTASATKANFAKTKISEIPNGGAAGPMAAFSYTGPFETAGTTDTYVSTFPTALGQAPVIGGTAGSGIIKGAFAIIQGARTAVKAIGDSALLFSNSVVTFSSSVDSVKGTIDNFASTLGGLDSTFSVFLKLVSTASPTITTAVQAFYGAIIGLATLSLIGVLLMTCCEQYKCRYLSYFSCFLFLILSILMFLLAQLFSIVVPTLFFACDFMEVSFASSAAFDTNFKKILADDSIRSYITACLPSSTGDLIGVLGGGTTNSINSLKDSVNALSSFDGAGKIASINSAFTTLLSTINQYNTAKIVDVTNAAALTSLNRVADPANYAACGTAVPNFATDSWVPANGQSPSYVSCRSSLGVNSDSVAASCNGGSTYSATCRGCMDTYSIFLGQTVSSGVDTALKARYANNAACNTFATELSNVWGQFLLVKKNTITPVKARADPTAQSAVTDYTNHMATPIISTFTSVLNQLNTTVNSIVDPKFGLIAGLNCRIFGEATTRLIDTLCIPMFNTFYYTRLVMGIIAFAMLFSMCCTVCSGVRHFKHSERKDRILPGMSQLQMRGGLDSSNAKFM